MQDQHADALGIVNAALTLLGESRITATRIASGITPTAPNGGTAANANDGDISTEVVATTDPIDTPDYVVAELDCGSEKLIAHVDINRPAISSASGSDEFIDEFVLETQASGEEWWQVATAPFRIYTENGVFADQDSVRFSLMRRAQKVRLVRTGEGRKLFTPAGTITLSSTSGATTIQSTTDEFEEAMVGMFIRNTGGAGVALVKNYNSGTELQINILEAFASTSPSGVTISPVRSVDAEQVSIAGMNIYEFAQSDRADTILDIYNQLRISILTAFRWRCTMRKRHLMRMPVSQVETEHEYSFQLPRFMMAGPTAAFLNESDIHPDKSWELYNNMLLSNDPFIYIDMQVREEEARWPPYLQLLMTYAFAGLAAEPLTDQTSKADYWTRKAFGNPEEQGQGGHFRHSRNIESQNKPSEAIKDFSLLETRFSYTGTQR